MTDRHPLTHELDGPPTGTTYWVTGLPGAGKSTLALALSNRLQAGGRVVLRLDGDRLRPIVGARHGFGNTDRREVGMIYARLCQEFAGQGADVICATVSMFHEVRRWNHDHLPAYREIYLRASPQTIAARHPKGLLAAGLAGRIRNVPGVDLPIEAPLDPDVLVDDDGSFSSHAIADRVLAQLFPLGAPA
jgi:adenylylsulfate kinase